MRKIFKNILLLLSIAAAAPLLAQNGTSSPFSRYAYGDLNDNVPTAYRAMGGVGIGMRGNKVICSAQPASYTACDSLTFMFDLGASVGWSTYKDANGTRNKANGNLEYLTVQFPLYKKWVAFSAGVLPYSSVGYDILLSQTVDANTHAIKSYQGNGGINEVYGGLSVNICDWAALGANVYYMFGDINNTRTLTFAETNLVSVAQSTVLHVSSVRFRAGAQLFHTFSDHTVVLGGIFEPKVNLNSELYVLDVTNEIGISDTTGGFQMPMTYGAGISYCWGERLTIGFDYQRQNMGDVKFIFEDEVLVNRNRYSVGVEYRHNPLGRKYVERMSWRVGCNVSDSYVNSNLAKDLTVSLGIGLPLRNVGTVFNASIEYNHRGSDQLVENSLKLTLNASIAENWFFKRKL